MCAMVVCAVFSPVQGSLDITLIANSGFLVSGDSQRVLIDGMFTQGFTYFSTPSDSVLNLERTASSPFDAVNAVIVSHSDADHFNGTLTAAHLSANAKGVLLTTGQVVDSMKKLPSYDRFASRVAPGVDSFHVRIDTAIAGIRFNAFALRHDSLINPKGPPNLGCIFAIDGIKIFHPGDGPSHDLSAFQNMNLASEGIDIAFLPYWFFDATSGGVAKKIIDYLRPKAIIMVHAMLGKDSTYRALAKENSTDSMQVYYMEPSMKTLRFVKQCNLDTVGGAVPTLAPGSLHSVPERLRAGGAVVAGNDENHFVISRDFPNGAAHRVDVIDNRGRTVLVASLEKCRRNGKIIIDAKNVAPGLYVLRFRR